MRGWGKAPGSVLIDIISLIISLLFIFFKYREDAAFFAADNKHPGPPTDRRGVGLYLAMN